MMTASNYAADAFVTAANPAPGRLMTVQYPVRSGTQWTTGSTTRQDGGIGMNVYVAGGAGAGGAVPIVGAGGFITALNPVLTVNTSSFLTSSTTASVILPANSNRAGFTIFNNSNAALFLGVTSSLTTASFLLRISPGGLYESDWVRYTDDIWGVWAEASTSGAMVTEWIGGAAASGSGGSGSGGTSVTVTNFPAIQDVNIVSPLPLQVSGNVGVVGTASVYLQGASAPLNVTGTITVDNLPVTQSVFVVNQQSSSITGSVTVTSSQANPVWVTQSGGGGGGGAVSQSGAWTTLVSGTVTATFTGSVPVDTGTFPTVTTTSSQTNPVWVTGTITTSGGGGGGAVTQGGGWTTLVSGTVTATFTGSVPVDTGTFPVVTVLTGAMPVVQVSQQSAWAALVSGTVTATFTGAVPVNTGTFPVVTVLTGAMPVVSVTATQASPVWVTQSGGGTVTQGSAWTTLVSGVVTATFTGSVPVNTGTFPVVTVLTGAMPLVQVSQQSAWSSLISGTVTATFTGAVPVDTGTFPTVTVLTGAFPTVTVLTGVFPVVDVTSSLANPAWVTGTVTVQGGTGGGAVTQGGAWTTLVSGTVTATFTGSVPVDTGTFPVVTVTSSQALPVWITQSGGGGSVTVSNTASVTSSQANPVWVTGTVATGTFPVVTVTATLTSPMTVVVSGNLSASFSGTSTGSVIQIPVSTTGVQLIGNNTARAGVAIFNQTTQVLYVRLGGTASLTNFTVALNVSGYYETPWNYNGPVWGLNLAGGTGFVYVTEVA